MGIEEQLDELVDDVGDDMRAVAPCSVIIDMLVNEHISQAGKYVSAKLAGRVSTIAGQKDRAATEFAAARECVQRIQALRTVAEERDIVEEFDTKVQAWLDAQRAAGRTVNGDDIIEPTVQEKATSIKTARERRKK